MANSKWDSTEEGKAYYREYAKGRVFVNIKLRKDSETAAAFENACNIEGATNAEYLRKAVKNRLKREGFIK